MKSHSGEKANKCNQSVLAGQSRQSSAVLHYLFLSPPRPFLGIQSWYLDIHRAQDNARNSWERTLEKRPKNTSDYKNFLSCLLTFEPSRSEYSLRQCTVKKSWKLHSTGRDKNDYFFHFVFKTSREYTEETSKNPPNLDIWIFTGQEDNDSSSILLFVPSPCLFTFSWHHTRIYSVNTIHRRSKNYRSEQSKDWEREKITFSF